MWHIPRLFILILSLKAYTKQMLLLIFWTFLFTRIHSDLV